MECPFKLTANTPAPIVTPALTALIVPGMTNLHNELFLQLQRLNSPDLKGEDMKNEIERSRAITGLGQTMINNADLVVRAHIRVANSVASVAMPTLINGLEVLDDGGDVDEAI